MLALALAACLLIPALPTGDAPATIDGLAPDQGAPGTEFVVEGAGFGAKRPRAWLEQAFPSGGKVVRRKLKVLEHADDRLVLRVRKAPRDAWHVVVKPRGGEPVVSEALFFTTPPAITSVTPTQVGTGGRIEIAGERMGRRRPKVWVGETRAKKVRWIERGVSLSAVVRGGTAEGNQVVQVRNALGSGGLGDIRVVDADPPSLLNRMDVTLDGLPMVTTDARSSAIATPEGGLEVSGGFQHGKTCRGLVLRLPVDVDGPFPARWSETEPGADLQLSRRCCFLPVPDGNGGCGQAIHLSTLDPTQPWSVEVDRAGGRLTGAFSATLVDFNGQQVLMEAGTFEVDLPGGG